MKTILIFLFSIHVLSVNAQTNDEGASQNKKPSWSEKIPERSDAPEINMDYKPDTDLEIDMGDLGMDRETLFDEDDTSDIVEAEIELENDAGLIEQNENTEAAKLAEQERIANAEKLAEQERIAEAEKLAEQKRIADERQRSLDKLAEEKRIADQLAEEKRIADQLAEEELAENTGEEQEITAIQGTGEYKWKRVKNVLPEYPLRAVRNKTEGWVSVEIVIAPDGQVVDARVIDSFRNLKVFNEAAINAVRRWKFDPPVNYGINTNQSKVVKITFEL